MRLGVVDIGSNSARLQIVDGEPGGPPLPTYAVKTPIRLAETLDEDGSIGDSGVERLLDALTEAVATARAHGVEEVIVFATSALRDAPNVDAVHHRVLQQTGVDIRLLSGEDEARLTFLAARRWLGWSAGPLLLLDIGGGSMEVAWGRGERPELAVSLPLGAGRLTGTHLRGDPPRHRDVKALRRHVRQALGEVADRLQWEGRPAHVVATSKTFKQLARLGGAPRGRKGPFRQRTVHRGCLRTWIPRLESLPARKRADLPGISAARARQILAGAIAAEAAMTAFDVKKADVCPWALREGVLLRRLDALPDPAEISDGQLIRAALHSVAAGDTAAEN
jgi:exopolyphosphatase / guanosine-5'-triphosphate,3'-diphosphate pyrophosphatase